MVVCSGTLKETVTVPVSLRPHLSSIRVPEHRKLISDTPGFEFKLLGNVTALEWQFFCPTWSFDEFLPSLVAEVIADDRFSGSSKINISSHLPEGFAGFNASPHLKRVRSTMGKRQEVPQIYTSQE